jgi:hypothetical protein
MAGTKPLHLSTDILGAAGALWVLVSLFSPPNPWWFATSWSAAGGAMMCWAAWLISGHRTCLRLATGCGLIAGGFALAPDFIQEPTLSALFRVFIPFALRRAVRMRSSGGWLWLTLVMAAAVPAAPVLVDVAVLLALAWTGAEHLALERPRVWSPGFAVCMVAPVAIIGMAALGMDLKLAGVVALHGSILCLVAFSAVGAVSIACEYRSVSHVQNVAFR